MKKTLLLMVPALLLAASLMAQCPDEGRKNVRIEKRTEMDGARSGHQGRGQWWENPVMAKQIGLSEEQIRKIDAMATAHRKEMIKLQADLKIVRIELDELMDRMDNETAIRKKAAEALKLKEKMYNSRLEHRLAVQKQLTAEQKKKLAEIRPRGMDKNLGRDCKGCRDK
jgi:Spy/CpxP family protein refolding chaperone